MKGYTLVETAVVIGIITFALGALTVLYLNFSTVLGTSGGQRTAAAEARQIAGEVQSLALPATQVLASRAFSGTTYTSGASTLVLELPSLDEAGEVVAGEYDYAVIYLTGSTTVRILDPDAVSSRVAGTKKLGANVESLIFTYDNADFAQVGRVDVSVRTRVTVREATFAHELREQAYLRNH